MTSNANNSALGSNPHAMGGPVVNALMRLVAAEERALDGLTDAVHSGISEDILRHATHVVELRSTALRPVIAPGEAKE